MQRNCNEMNSELKNQHEFANENRIKIVRVRETLSLLSVSLALMFNVHVFNMIFVRDPMLVLRSANISNVVAFDSCHETIRTRFQLS